MVQYKIVYVLQMNPKMLGNFDEADFCNKTNFDIAGYRILENLVTQNQTGLQD